MWFLRSFWGASVKNTSSASFVNPIRLAASIVITTLHCCCFQWIYLSEQMLQSFPLHQNDECNDVTYGCACALCNVHCILWRCAVWTYRRTSTMNTSTPNSSSMHIAHTLHIHKHTELFAALEKMHGKFSSKKCARNIVSIFDIL